MWALAVIVVVGLMFAIRWGAGDIEPPWDRSQAPGSVKEAVRRYLWYVTLMVGPGVVAGLVMIGAGGRLAMRILGAAAGDDAQGRITEADQVVGRITVDGTMGFIGFNGIVGGLLTGGLFLLIHRWLPRGRLRGIAYGALLLVLAATRIDPLRPDNIDFNIVGPGWLSVLVFVSLGIGHGMLVDALTARYGQVLPRLEARPRVLVYYAPLLLLIPGLILLLPVAIGMIIAAAAGAVREGRFWTHPRFDIGMRVLLALVTLVALPGFLTGVWDIATR